ncbi:hypothetical protein D6V10_07835 [Vibrio cholerae]|uniref:Molecular chaperone DnaJ n=1 Tax=Vibrio cholerae TaxID=666 RepID=A0A7Z7VK80_VIBCL|nr:hypothetical protein [Vibrio cholerae]POC39193.1 hypothetical protein CRN55_08165 [Vibrio vulnificus]BEI26156.1 hypothetical protein KKIDH5335_44880 [Vibrio fluvialis]PNV69414.1 hypothetical protein C1Y48_18415 [Vibrio cholerae]TBM37414.1 hypothetical protein EYB64_19045 [Vibrio cholerae]
MSTFNERKASRKEYYFRFIYGWILVPCAACNGSGYYDSNGSPPCGSCDGSGKERIRGTKAISSDRISIDNIFK